MAGKRILLTLEPRLFDKAKKKADKMCCKTVQDYLVFLLQRDLFTGHKGAGRQLTGIASDVAVLTSQKPVFTEEKEWFKKKKK